MLYCCDANLFGIHYTKFYTNRPTFDDSVIKNILVCFFSVNSVYPYAGKTKSHKTGWKRTDKCLPILKELSNDLLDEPVTADLGFFRFAEGIMCRNEIEWKIAGRSYNLKLFKNKIMCGTKVQMVDKTTTAIIVHDKFCRRSLNYWNILAITYENEKCCDYYER